MRKTVSRGGTLDYEISKVLGNKFYEFIHIIKNDGINAFLVEKYDPELLERNSNINPKDVHCDFTQFLIAVATALRYIEHPDVEKVAFSKQLEDMIKGLETAFKTGISGKGSEEVIEKEEEFELKPITDNKIMERALVQAYLDFPFNKPFYHDLNVKGFKFANLIRYLYHFIALLDLTGIDAEEVTSLIKKDEKNKKYFDEITKSDTDIAKNASFKGVSVIAQKIIDSYRRSDVKNPDTDQFEFNYKVPTDFNSTAEAVILYAKQILGSVPLDLDNAIRKMFEEAEESISGGGFVFNNFSSLKITANVPQLVALESAILWGDKNIPKKEKNYRLGRTEINNLNSYIERQLQNYVILKNRLDQIPEDNSFNGLFDQYIKDFLTEVQVYLANNAKKTEYGTRSVVSKTNLADPKIKDFYKNVVLSKPEFYKLYFNLIKYSNTGKILDSDVAFGQIPDTELSDYRLNVRKLIGFSRLREGMFGGNDISQTVIVSLIPDYDENMIASVWVTKDKKINKETLTKLGKDALRDIANAVFNSDYNQDQVTIPGKITVTLSEIVKREIQNDFFHINKQAYFQDLTSRILRGGPEITPMWKENEQKLSEHVLRSMSKWERDGDQFILRDNNGNVVNKKFTDSCAFIKNDAEECVDSFKSCLNSNGDFEDACGGLLDFDFEVNISMTEAAKAVSKIDPAVAFGILQKFKFGQYLDTEGRDGYPFPGFHKYKVQSVGSWLEEIQSGSNRCGGAGAQVSASSCDPRPLYVQLGRLADKILKMANDPKKHNFFSYLDYLVQWVNANPQVLNKEIDLKPSPKGFYPASSKRFDIYDYKDPYRRIELKLFKTCNDLDRLKSSIMNDISGVSGSTIISNIAQTPLGITMPLGRYAFASSAPLGALLPMQGGSAIYETEAELKRINERYGYNLFQTIYHDLIQTMENVPGEKKMKLSDPTRLKIENKLTKFKDLEGDLRAEMINLIERNKLYQASHGYINVGAIDDPNKYAALLAKHSNLLKISQAYNLNATNLIDTFKTIISAILNKFVEEPEAKRISRKVEYDRPLNPGLRSVYN